MPSICKVGPRLRAATKGQTLLQANVSSLLQLFQVLTESRVAHPKSITDDCEVSRPQASEHSADP